MAKIDRALIGASGVHFIAGELLRMGYIALTTSRNTKGIDVIATNPSTNKFANIQVKTYFRSKKNLHWLVGEKAENLKDPNFSYVFVDLSSEHPEYYVVPSEIVAEYVKATHQAWLREPGKAHRDSSMRQFPNRMRRIDLKQFQRRWELLKLD